MLAETVSAIALVISESPYTPLKIPDIFEYTRLLEELVSDEDETLRSKARKKVLCYGFIIELDWPHLQTGIFRHQTEQCVLHAAMTPPTLL